MVIKTEWNDFIDKIDDEDGRVSMHDQDPTNYWVPASYKFVKELSKAKGFFFTITYVDEVKEWIANDLNDLGYFVQLSEIDLEDVVFYSGYEDMIELGDRVEEYRLYEFQDKGGSFIDLIELDIKGFLFEIKRIRSLDIILS